jgi:hypothetical protein
MRCFLLLASCVGAGFFGAVQAAPIATNLIGLTDVTWIIVGIACGGAGGLAACHG